MHITSICINLEEFHKNKFAAGKIDTFLNNNNYY